MTEELKDEALARVSTSANVAQFASFAPRTSALRHVAILGHHGEASAHTTIMQLLRMSSTGTVNVRSFKPGENRGNPFIMGLSSVDDVLAQVQSLGDADFYTIVNENVDVHDGGVSGVRWNNWTEFAPDDTPRCVEKPGTAGLPAKLADDLFELVYRSRTPLPNRGSDTRLEFSVHPGPVGFRQQRSIVWEVSAASPRSDWSSQGLSWPNLYSNHIGDKAYGLLIGHLLGFPVPHTQVIARKVAPFVFGEDTGHDATWTRTCPRHFSPGEFPTESRYVDVFQMLHNVDPSGELIGSVLIQQGVNPAFSGAVADSGGGKPVISGVRGEGTQYMMGGVGSETLPVEVEEAVARMYSGVMAKLGGPCRCEWVSDLESCWMVQLNRDTSGGFDVSLGEADHWIEFDPAEGVGALKRLISRVSGSSTGVRLTRAVGLTSHIGDLLRMAKVPARVPNVNNAVAERGGN